MSSITHFQATYTDGCIKDFDDLREVEFTKDHDYNIQVKQGWFGTIIVSPCGPDWQVHKGMDVTYPSLHHFFHDWDIKEMVHPEGTGHSGRLIA